MHCPNCDTETAGRYCPSCGQRTDTGKLFMRVLLARSFHELTSFEQPLLRTFRALLRHPGRVATEYVRGRRVHYTNPIKWALVSTALAFFAARLTGAQGPVNVNLTSTADMPAWAQPLYDFLVSNTAPLFVLLMLPLLALSMRICFHGTRRNSAEELVLVLYTYGCAALLQIVYSAAIPLGAPPGLAGPLPLIWAAWAAVSFHPTRRAVVSVLLTVLAHTLWILLMGSIIGGSLLVGHLLGLVK